MISNFNVPDPCSESWNGMRPAQNGRYCSSCRKIVLDFTNKTNEDILAIIAANAGKKLCGTFRTSQLPPPPRPATSKQTIRFLAAALLAFGMTLFSCSNNAPRIPTVIQAPPDTSVLPPKAPNANDPTFLPPEPGKEKEKKTAGDEDYPIPEIVDEGGPYSTITGTIEAEPGEADNDVPPVPVEPEPVTDDVTVGIIVESISEFPNGEKGMRMYLDTAVHMPPGNAEGTVYIGFTVKADGRIDHIKLLRGVSPELDEEALRVVRKMPRWKPGTQNGRAVDVEFNLPVKFHRR